MNRAEQSNIHIKSYFAPSVPDGIEVARAELGVEALLLSSRPAPAEMRHLGAVEVVFGIQANKKSAAPPAPPAPPAPAVDELHQKMEQIHELLIRSGIAPPAPKRTVGLITQVLVEAGLSSQIASAIDDAVTSRIDRKRVFDISRGRKPQDGDQNSMVEETLAEIDSRISVNPELRPVTALAGPPGVGKTSTLVKLAVAEGLMKGRPVRLICADGERIGAADQLRNYAAILGVQFELAVTTAALSQAVDSAPEGYLTLIDTPGYGPALFDTAGDDLATFFSRRQDIDVHLVLTATTRYSDAASMAKRFDAFNPSAIIFTRLDEIGSAGTIVNEAIRSAKPVSWLCAGQLIPEDIEAASKRRITGDLVSQLPLLTRSAA